MKKSLHLIRQKISSFLYYSLCIFLLFFASACGDTDYSSGDNRSSESGSISFSVEWQGAPTVRGAAGSNVTRVLDCTMTGVSTVEAEVYDQSGNSIASGGPWNCAAHSGRIDNVPVGFDRTVEIMGKNQWGDIIYQGEQTGINVTTDQTTNTGTIVASYAIPTNFSATAGDGEITLSWDSVSGATGYNIYWDATPGVDPATSNIIWVDSAYDYYVHSGLTNGDPNYYIITAVFDSGESGESEEVKATPSGGAVGKPDLTVTITNVESDGSNVTIYYDVYNNGNADAGAFYVDVWPHLDSPPAQGSLGDGYTQYVGLAAVSSISDSTSVSSSLSGGTAYAVVDADQQVDESNENNNLDSRNWPTNSLGMAFKLIPAGTFTMGSPLGEPGRDSDETQHQVTLTQAFYIQTTEVTQAQWVTVMGSNPSNFSGCSDCPVEQVSWDDVQTFITNLNTWGEGTYRLPTEAEWEYAARAGSTTAFANGDITYTDCTYDSNLDVMGWYCYNSSSTQSVGQKDSNAWGLYDMHGNVWEWCQDWYGAYPSGSVTDPTGPFSGSERVTRGGGWYNYAMSCRSAYRNSGLPDFIGDVLGFRLVRNP